MRGTVVTKIRTKVFGEQSTRGKRRYARVKETGQVVNLGLRIVYQRTKRLYVKGEVKL